jgi:hypothetical protein
MHSARDFILPIIDFFYPPFKRLMNLQTFRYAASGGGNTLLGLIIYYISYKYIFFEKMFHFGFYAFKGHNAALFLSFCITFPVGFFMSKYVVFIPKGSKVSVVCRTKKGKRCKGKLRASVVKKKARGKLRLKKLQRRKYPAGSRIDATITNPKFKTQFKTLVIRKRGNPSIITKCATPPSKKRRNC